MPGHYQISWHAHTLGVTDHVDSVRGVRHNRLDLGPHSLHLVVHAVINAVLKTELRECVRICAEDRVGKHGKRAGLASYKKTYQVVECIYVDDHGAWMSIRDETRQVAQVSWPAQDAVHENHGAVAIGGTI